jgi:hypothetical protein
LLKFFVGVATLGAPAYGKGGARLFFPGYRFALNRFVDHY